MLNRKPSATPGKALPQDWIDSVSELLDRTYEKECDARSRQFDVYGQIYPHELFVVISLLPKDSASEGAISCFLSCEPADIATAQKVKETQSAYVDIAGLFFDEIFANPEWNEWEPQWQEVEWKDKKFWYKLTRENVRLTLEADQLLKNAGFDLTEDLIADEDDEEKIIH